MVTRTVPRHERVGDLLAAVRARHVVDHRGGKIAHGGRSGEHDRRTLRRSAPPLTRQRVAQSAQS